MNLCQNLSTIIAKPKTNSHEKMAFHLITITERNHQRSAPYFIQKRAFAQRLARAKLWKRPKQTTPFYITNLSISSVLFDFLHFLVKKQKLVSLSTHIDDFCRCGCKQLVRYFTHSVLEWEDFLPTAALTSLTTTVKSKRTLLTSISKVLKIFLSKPTCQSLPSKLSCVLEPCFEF